MSNSSHKDLEHLLDELDGDLFSEAEEGFASFPEARSDKAMLDQRARKELGLSTGTSFPLWYGLMAIVPLLAVLLGHYYVTGERSMEVEEPEYTQVAQETNDQAVFIEELNPSVRAEDSAQLASEIIIAESLPANEFEKPIITDAEQHEQEVYMAQLPEFIALPPPERIDRMSAGPLGTRSAIQRPKDASINLVYVHDMLVIDLTSFYNKKIRVVNKHFSTSGTRVYNEERTESPAVIDSPYRYITYLEMLDSALGYFSANEFERSIHVLNSMLNTYPGDVNALFYSGLCKYNLGLTEGAIERFQLVQGHFLKTFDQEAAWYLALSYDRQNDPKTDDLLRSIRDKGGFYSKRAQELLRKRDQVSR